VFFVSVASDDRTRALAEWIKQRWSMDARQVRAQREQLGVINSYGDPKTLGADRWAALLGARERSQRDCAIVGCGTAVTVDLLTGEGVFAGGVIFPGLHLLRRSLDIGTAGVRANVGDDSSCLARSTADGVAAGTLFGLVGAIERVLTEHEQTLGEEPLEILITGGDAELVMSRLARRAIHVPNLVLDGLSCVAEADK
jgi:type III pantothenate kinase